MTEPAPNQHGQVIGLVAIATMALPRAAALCTCAAHARHPSTSCLFQQQAVDVFLQKKKKKKEKKPRGCATGPELGPPPNPLPSPVCDTPAFVTGRRKGEFSPLQFFSKLALCVHNHHSAAQCKMLFFKRLAATLYCPLQGLSCTLSGYWGIPCKCF